MKRWWGICACCEIIKISIGYESIGIFYRNDDKLHVPWGRHFNNKAFRDSLRAFLFLKISFFQNYQ